MAFTRAGSVVTQTANTTDAKLISIANGSRGPLQQQLDKQFFTVPGFSASLVTVDGTSVAFTTSIESTGLEVTIAATTSGQTVVVTYAAAERTFDGPIAVYELGVAGMLVVAGTLTINPERERLVIDANFGLNVINGGRLNLGVDITRNGVTRFSQGLALVFDRAPPRWHGSTGNLTSFRIQSGAILDWRGATVQGPFSFAFFATSNILIQDVIMRVINVGIGQTDPTTGETVANTTRTGVNTGIAGNADVLLAGRGYISWIITNRYSIDNLRLEGDGVNGGGELLVQAPPLEVASTIDPTKQNGLRGYGAQYGTNSIFPNRVAALALSDTVLGNQGNDIDIGVSTEQRPGGEFTTTTVTNERSGTLIRPLTPETGGDLSRNRGNAIIQREFQVTANDLSTGSAIIDGGRYFIRDTNNTFRSSVNGRDDTEDFTYSDTFASGSAPIDNVILGIVKVSNLSYSLGNNPPITAGNRRYVRGTTTTVPLATNPNSMDVRGKQSTPGTPAALGSDLFDVHVWHPNYQYSISEVDMSDDSIGVRALGLNLPIDADYQVTDFAAAGEIRTLDEIYKAEKLRKVATETDIELPNITSLYTVPTGSVLDLGDLPFNVSATATERYEASGGGMTAGGILTAGFNGAGVTRVGGNNNTLANQGDRGQFVIDDEVGLSTSIGSLPNGTARSLWVNDGQWSSVMSIYVDNDSSGSAGIATTNDPILVYVDNANYAVFTPTAGSQTSGVTSRSVSGIATDSQGNPISAGNAPGDEVQVTVVYGPLAMLYQEGMTLPASITVASTALTAGTVFDGITTTAQVDNGGLAVDYALTAGSVIGLPTSGEIITADGSVTGGIALAAGNYRINGDASGVRFTRSGSSGTVTLVFGPDATRPTAPLGANVEAPFQVTINGIPDSTVSANTRLSVYLNGTLQTPTIASGSTTLSIPEAGTQRLDIIWSGEGRSDFKRTITDVNADEIITVLTSPQPYPDLPTGTTPANVMSQIVPSAAPITTGVPSTGLEIQITGDTFINSQTVISWALQNTVKGTEAYNNAFRQNTVTEDIIGSDGRSSTASINGAIAKFTSTSPYTIGYIREQDNANQADSISVTGSFTPAGGSATTIMVGVTIGPVANFDPAITGSQIGTAVNTITANINTGVDAELRRGTITNVGRPPLP